MKPSFSKLHTGRNELTEHLLNNVFQDNSHKLHPLLPVLNSCPRSLRSMCKCVRQIIGPSEVLSCLMLLQLDVSTCSRLLDTIHEFLFNPF